MILPSYYSRLGSDNQVQNSILGTNGTLVGTPTYQASKFGNGVYSNNVANYINIGNGQWFNPNAHTIDVWINTDYSVTDGVPSSASTNVPWFWYHDANNWAKWLVRPTVLLIQYRVGGTFYSINLTTNITWAASTDTHTGYLMNRNGINGGSNTFEFYINGAIKGSSTLAIANQANAGTMFNLLVQNEGGLVRFPWVGSLDNFKAYNYNRLNFDDRFDERGGLNDIITIM
jgi:hypothetical protein